MFVQESHIRCTLQAEHSLLTSPVHRPGRSVRGVSVQGTLSRLSLSGGLCQGGSLSKGVLCPRGSLGVSVGGSLSGGFLSEGVSVRKTPMHLCAGGTHLTGMHSCFLKFSQSFLSLSQCLYFYKNQSQYDFDSSLTLLLGNHLMDPPLVHKPK